MSAARIPRLRRRTKEERGCFPLSLKNMDLNNIAIIGYGIVGRAVHSWFKQAKVYSRSQFNNWDNVKNCDVFFICVPTPYVKGGEYDLSAIEEAVAKIADGKIIIIKSTVNPGTTDYFQNKYPNKIFMFNPEFLDELTAEKDFKNPDMQILGVPYQGYKIASTIIQMLPPAPIMRIVSPIDAEWIKKARNAFYAVKVIFFNQLYDLIKEPADYETIRSILVKDRRIGDSHSFIFHKNYRGFGGKCLPKDLYALIEFAEKNNSDPKLFKVVRDINNQLLKKQNISEWIYE